MEFDFTPEFSFRFMLIFARVGTLIMLLPSLGSSRVPVRIRLSFALLFSLLLFPVISEMMGELPAQPLQILVLLAREMLIGFFIGLTVRMILMTTSIAGTALSNQIGLGLAQSIDPSQGVQGALFANFLAVLATTLVFMMDLHHLAIIAIYDSYQLFEFGLLTAPGDMTMAVLMALSDSFVVGIQMAAPFLVFGLAFYLGIGILNRLMPQIQIFFIAMPASIVLGFLLLLVLIGAMMAVYTNHYEAIFSHFLVISPKGL